MEGLFAKLKKIEIAVLIVMIALFFLAFKAILPTIVYLVLAMLIGLYFSPLKIIATLRSKVENKYIHIGISFLISTSLIVSYVFLINTGSLAINYYVLFLLFFNMIFLYLWKSKIKEQTSLILLLLNLVLLSGIFLV